MSDKSFLDKTASIATILGLPVAIVAAYFAWLAISPKQEDPNPKQGQDVVVEPKPQASSVLQTTEINSNPAGPDSLKNGTQWSCEDVGGDLSAAFSAAKGIRYKTHRDDVLVPLSKQALCVNKFDLFESIVNEISFRTTKDEALVDGVDFVLKLRRFDLAEKYAGLISFRTTADKVRERIAIAAVKKI